MPEETPFPRWVIRANQYNDGGNWIVAVKAVDHTMPMVCTSRHYRDAEQTEEDILGTAQYLCPHVIDEADGIFIELQTVTDPDLLHIRR